MDPQQSPLPPLRMRIHAITETNWFNNLVLGVIVVNSIALGLETSPIIVAKTGLFLPILDELALVIFCVEIFLKLFAQGWRFFLRGWNVFDFTIVAIALLPSSGALSVLRALRILRAFRLLSVIPKMRSVIEALLAAVPGMGAIIAVLLLVFYIAAVMATKLFGGDFPDWFGTIGASMYSLFQIMTLESWSMGIVRPVMREYPSAWLFFVPFIVVTSFAVLNLFIALIVNSMQTLHDDEERELIEKAEATAHDEREKLLAEMQAVKTELSELKKLLQQQKLKD